MLKAGISIKQIDCFRSLLEEHAFALTSLSNLRQIIPFIRNREIERLKRDIEKRPVSIIFNGTTHICEAMVVLLRYISEDWLIKQDVCRLMLLAKSMTGEEVARQIIVVLSTELGIPSHLLVGAMRDRASVNEVAMRTVRVVYNQCVDIGCFSHTLDHVGQRMSTPVNSSLRGLPCFLEVQRLVCFGRARQDCLHLLILALGGGVDLRLYIISFVPLEIFHPFWMMKKWQVLIQVSSVKESMILLRIGS